ncbi:Cysteine desulfurase [Caenispirillum salinarum AK4]|uniref:Cysteine desulfurase n=1 Tax=Caenispirillum salinarum AK4 TaxID=1238182 RepID=K9GN92_9PROT|nr:cysteine desulfurase family protein [Caenispirillum salinarum]EKV26119.1 Cysteine desulfurase [Caenispirillum salinarum AK4]
MSGSRSDRPAVYLDYNATAPLRPEALEAMTRALEAGGNPSSVHGPGRRARATVEDAREAVAALVNARPEQVIFTSGGTEADALALTGTGRARAIVSAVEHDAVLKAHPETRLCPVDSHGILDLEALAALLAEEPEPARVIVSVMLANNETGAVQPVKKAAKIAHDAGAIIHCDAVQGPGRMAVDIHALRVDLLTLSAHKLGGPPGVGALIVADPLALAPVQRGGGQERGKRAGTENVPGIAGFGAVAKVLASRGREEAEAARALQERLEAGIADIAPSAVIHGAGAAARLPNTTCVGLPGVTNQSQLMALDLGGVAVSAGAACSSGKVAASHVLRAMGLSEETAREAVRISLGWASTVADVDAFLEAWRPLARRARPVATVDGGVAQRT